MVITTENKSVSIGPSEGPISPTLTIEEEKATGGEGGAEVGKEELTSS